MRGRGEEKETPSKVYKDVTFTFLFAKCCKFNLRYTAKLNLKLKLSFNLLVKLEFHYYSQVLSLHNPLALKLKKNMLFWILEQLLGTF